MRRALWLALLMPLVASPAPAEVRRLEVVGVVPAGADAAPGVSAREAALGAGLRQGVERVARELLSEAAAADPGLDLGPVLGGNPGEFTLGYRVVEDRGERRALLLADPAISTEYVLMLEVFVDVDRLEARLEEAGLLPEEPAEVARQELRVVVEPLPSYRTYLSLRQHLGRVAGAGSVTPALFESGRAELRVDAALAPGELMDRLVRLAPEGLRLEPVFADSRSLWIRIDEPPGPLED